MMQHSMSCHYPEGCQCGASAWNRLEAERDKLRDISQKLYMALNDAMEVGSHLMNSKNY